MLFLPKVEVVKNVKKYRIKINSKNGRKSPEQNLNNLQENTLKVETV